MASFVDNTGATRHAMGRKELNELYKQLENFIADSTPGEVERNQMELARVKTMIAERIRETYKKYNQPGAIPAQINKLWNYSKV